jgi:hypothetical protein
VTYIPDIDPAQPLKRKTAASGTRTTLINRKILVSIKTSPLAK